MSDASPKAQRRFMTVVGLATWVAAFAIGGWIIRTAHLQGAGVGLVMWAVILGPPLAWHKWGPKEPRD